MLVTCKEDNNPLELELDLEVENISLDKIAPRNIQQDNNASNRIYSSKCQDIFTLVKYTARQ